MPFLSFSEKKDIEGIGHFNKQRETAGRFLIYRSENYEENNINLVRYILSHEIINNPSIRYDDNAIKFNIGEIGIVEIIEGDAVFHTHPFINYKEYNVLIGPPSGPDIVVFLNSIFTSFNNMQSICGDKCVTNECNMMPKVPKFGCVISIEGLYIYSLSQQGLRRIINYYKTGNMSIGNFNITLNKQTQIDFLNSFRKAYEYPFKMRPYNWETYYEDKSTPDESIVKNAVDKYLDWFKTINDASYGDLFDVVFTPWKEFNNDTFFRIYYYNGTILKTTPTNQEQHIEDTKMDVVYNQDTNTNIVH